MMEVEAPILMLAIALILLIAIVAGLYLAGSLSSIGPANRLKAYSIAYCNGTALKPSGPGLYNCPPCLVYIFDNETYADCPGATYNTTAVATSTTYVTATTTVATTVTTTATSTVTVTSTSTTTTTVTATTTTTITIWRPPYRPLPGLGALISLSPLLGAVALLALRRVAG